MNELLILVFQKSCPKVTISTRSGAWIIPNYISGFATDLYACRAFFKAPWKISTRFLELVIKFIYGNPKKYNLNPKMRALQAQPTVSPTIVHHIQRNEVKIKPNIRVKILLMSKFQLSFILINDLISSQLMETKLLSRMAIEKILIQLFYAQAIK